MQQLSSSIWSIYLSQLIRYSRACGSYQDVLDRELLLTRKLLNQGFLMVKLKSSLCKVYQFICSNIPAAPAYGVYISQLIRYSRACGSYQDVLDRELLLTRKLLNQGFLFVKLKSSLRTFYDRHHDLIDRYGISVSQMTTDMFHLL